MNEIDIAFREIMDECEKYDPYQIQAQKIFEDKESYERELAQ